MLLLCHIVQSLVYNSHDCQSINLPDARHCSMHVIIRFIRQYYTNAEVQKYWHMKFMVPETGYILADRSSATPTKYQMRAIS
jgi:hypothetical protein